MSVDISDIVIESKQPEVPMVDIMGGDARWDVKIHEHGLVSMLDVMPRMVPEGSSADFAIVQSARVSYGAGTKKVNQDRGLIRYLARHRHTTPFEMVEFKFHCVMPMFIARQWIRHRTANVNEYSARYSVVPDRFYRPSMENIRQQSKSNRQGGEGTIDDMTAQEFLDYLDKAESVYQDYEKLIEKGLTREQARIGLPVSAYTEWYWKIDLHNLFHFISLRMDSHAQQEIQDYAKAMYAMVSKVCPIAAEAFIDYNFESFHLSRLEIEAIKNNAEIDTDNKREKAEWEAKKKELGL